MRCLNLIIPFSKLRSILKVELVPVAIIVRHRGLGTCYTRRRCPASQNIAILALLAEGIVFNELVSQVPTATTRIVVESLSTSLSKRTLARHRLKRLSGWISPCFY